MTNEEICADFRRRYEGTFVKIESHDGRVNTLAKLSRVRQDSEKVATLDLTTREFGVISTNLGSEEYKIKFEYPQAGVFQRGKDAVVFSRRPERQYSRGVSSATCRVELCTSNLTGNTVSMDIYTVSCAFEHKVVTFKEGLDLLNRSKLRSVALNNNFAMCLPLQKDRKQYVMWHLTSPVAVVTEQGEVLRVLEPVFNRVLKDVIRG